MTSERRDLAMIAALETLMGEMGDMHIPISALWLERLIRRAGIHWEIYDHEEPREVDAAALAALCQIARWNFTHRLHNEVAPAVEPSPDRETVGSYRVGHSKPPHAADGMVATVCMGGGAYSTIPNPWAGHHGSLGWTMTWGNYRPVILTARGVIESYEYLISGSINMKEATRRLRLLRHAYRGLVTRAYEVRS